MGVEQGKHIGCSGNFPLKINLISICILNKFTVKISFVLKQNNIRELNFHVSGGDEVKKDVINMLIYCPLIFKIRSEKESEPVFCK